MRPALMACMVSIVSAAAPRSAQAAAVSLQVAPARLVAVSGSSVRAELRLVATGAREFKVVGLWANTGKVSGLHRVGSRGFVAHWISPPMGFPTVVLLRADVRLDGHLVHRWAVLPVSLRQQIQVSAQKGENVQVVVAGNDFGPVKAKRSGQVAVEVVVSPWAKTYAIMRTDEYDVTKSETRHFNLPPFGRLAVVAPKTASAGDTIALEVFQVSARGQRYAYSNPLILQCPGATLLDDQDRKSVHRFKLRLGGLTGEITCTVFMKVEPKVKASFSLDVDVARRLKLALTVSRDRFKMGAAETAKVEVTVSDLFGNVADTDKLVVTANGRPLSMMRVGAGAYRGWLYSPSKRQPGDRIVVMAKASGAQPVRRIVGLDGGRAVRLSARLRPGRIMADGKRAAWLEVTATDRLGMPATDRMLQVDSDDGKMAFLHRVRPGLFRGRFVPRRRPSGGWAKLVIQTRRAPAITVRLRLLRLPQRFLLSPWAGGFFDLVRTAGGTASLRFEWAAYPGRPAVYIGAALLVSPFAATATGGESLVDHAGLSAGLAATGRLRVVASRRFSLDFAMDLGVLGLYSHYRERYGALVQANHASLAVFTASAALELGLVTRGAEEIFLRLAARYWTGRFEDAWSTNRATLLAGLGYRFSL